MDADSGKVVQTLEIGPGPDGCVFDAKRNLVFSSNGGDGTVSVIRAGGDGKYEVAKTIKTQASAKTIAMDPKDASPLPLGRHRRARAGPPSRRPRARAAGSCQVLSSSWWSASEL